MPKASKNAIYGGASGADGFRRGMIWTFPGGHITLVTHSIQAV